MGITRGNIRGVFSNAKPILLLAIIDEIAEGEIIGNRLPYTHEALKNKYHALYSILETNKTVTPINKPFFHLCSEPFFHIGWKYGTTIPKQAMSPSDSFLREHIEYAALDYELWDLLQNAEVRNELRETIINHYIKN